MDHLCPAPRAAREWSQRRSRCGIHHEMALYKACVHICSLACWTSCVPKPRCGSNNCECREKNKSHGTILSHPVIVDRATWVCSGSCRILSWWQGSPCFSAWISRLHLRVHSHLVRVLLSCRSVPRSLPFGSTSPPPSWRFHLCAWSQGLNGLTTLLVS